MRLGFLKKFFWENNQSNINNFIKLLNNVTKVVKSKKKMLTSSVTCDVINFFVTRKLIIQEMNENSYIQNENLHIFWTTWGIYMKFQKTWK